MAKEEGGSAFGVLSPVSDADRQSVRAELERLLADPLFRNSKRYPAFLRHVVEQTLAGKAALLKERSLGVDLFERPPDYDTNIDHIVRSTAAEIRKRIAQFYQAAGREAALRIELPPGSYVPEFRLAPKDQPVVPGTDAIKVPDRLPRLLSPRIAILLAAPLLLLIVVLVVMRSRQSGDVALERFWRPILDAPGQATIGITPPVGVAIPIPDPLTLPTFLQLHASEREHVSVGDAEAVALITSVLGAQHKSFQWKRTPISLTDLRQGPVILLGGFNNEWTIRLTGELRFSLHADADVRWIGDRLHPEKRDWSFDFGRLPTTSTVDYALISRISDPTTGRQLLAAAGIAKYGTVAAGEFMSSPALLSELDRRAVKGWESRNLQVVLRTKVISDHSGAPEIVAIAVW